MSATGREPSCLALAIGLLLGVDDPRVASPSRECSSIALAVILLLGLAFLLALAAHALSAEVPREALVWRSTLIRCARVEWGLDAPCATFGAQVHQESRWREDARSMVGAQGLAQFMPATANWLGGLRPDLGPAAPWNPGWALRGLVAYDRWLWLRVGAATACDRMAKVLSAYNGGLGWVLKDSALARNNGLDPRRWWGNVEAVNAGRSAAAKRENQGYPQRILLILEPLYVASGWGPGICERGCP